MTPFEICFRKLLGIEGDYSDHPSDSGGKTRWGVTEFLWRKYGYQGDISQAPVQLAQRIYREEFWDRWCCCACSTCSKACTTSMKRALLLAVLVNVIAPAAAAPDVDAGPILLVATEKLNDNPIYARTVLLASPANGGHVGLVLNRKTDARMQDLFPEFAPAKAISDTLYFGGGYRGNAIFALTRAAESPSNYSIKVMPGVWLVADTPTIDGIIETRPNEARYFIGFVAWRQGLLRAELDEGLFKVLPADAAKLFLPDTSKLYEQLAPPPGKSVNLEAFRQDLRATLRRGRETFPH